MRPPPPALVVACAAALAGCPALLPQDPAATTTTGADPSTSSPTTGAPDPTTGFQLVCFPGERRCDADDALQTCAPTGLEWLTTPCGPEETCVADVEAGTAACLGPCDLTTAFTSVGCEFLAIRMQSHNDDPGDYDALIVGNIDAGRSANLWLYYTPRNSFDEQLLDGPVELGPGLTRIFPLRDDPFVFYTDFRTGGVYRLESDRPVTAYLHSTFLNEGSNDASLLLPTRWLRGDYVVASYPGYTDPKYPNADPGRPSYFDIIALEHDTRVEFVPTADTAALGVQVPAVRAGETGAVTLARFDVLQIGASAITGADWPAQDLSGTVIRADKPIWVISGTECANVPFGVSYCNHLQEQLLPLEYWGRRYVGPHSPLRGSESHYWRIYAGEAGVEVTVASNSPDVEIEPFVLERRGAFRELVVPTGTSLIFTATGPILPVQYLAGVAATGTEVGDPSMYQMIPVEQWMKRYVFVTGVDYTRNYAQIVRRKGGADIVLDNELITDFYPLEGAGPDNQWEVADYELPGGQAARTFVAVSAEPFGVTVIGYKSKKPSSAYAYPAGTALTKLWDP